VPNAAKLARCIRLRTEIAHTDLTNVETREELRANAFQAFCACPALRVEVRKQQPGVMLAFADIATLKTIRKT
jgi:hypothetical protein